MSWNIEILVGRTPDVLDLVPDVFVPVDPDDTCSFEDATSGLRDLEICVGRAGDWTVVIDVACRITQVPEFLAEISGGWQVVAVRIADRPILTAYADGRRTLLVEGTEGCRALLADDEPDGELLAIGYLHRITGLTMPDALRDCRFQRFGLAR